MSWYKYRLHALLGIIILVLILVPGSSVSETLHILETTSSEVLTGDRKDYPWEEWAEDGQVEVLITLKKQADTKKAALDVKTNRDFSKDDLPIAVVESLRANANRTQRPLLEYLESKETDGKVEGIKSFFIMNVLYARVDIGLISDLAARPEVASVRPNESFKLVDPVKRYNIISTESKIEWNIERVNAPEVWAKGIDGSGVVVGIIDTGVDLAHEALLHKYRGYNPEGEHSHAYNWFDPHYDNRPVPDDIEGHGTHVTGIVLGSGPDGTNNIGVAPGAQWIAARGLNDEGRATMADLLAAMEFLLAPTPEPDGSGEPDPTKAPDIINNSWGSSVGKNEFFRPVLKSWRDAGIFPVFAAGNEGPGYGTIRCPGNYPEAFAVAATEKNDDLAGFSSRGAAPYSHPDSMQPNISAPGVNIRSAIPGNRYDRYQGTSMAAPHVAGVAALLLQSNPDLEVNQLENMLLNTAKPLTDNIYPDSPNYGYGYGLVDVLAALDGDQHPPPTPPEPDLFPPPFEEAAYGWVNKAANPYIPRGPISLKVPNGKLGVIKANFEITVLGCDFVKDTWHAIGYDNITALPSLYTVDPETGDHALVGPTGSSANLIYTGLAYDPKGDTLYASAFNYLLYDLFGRIVNNLYIIDPETGASTVVNTITGVEEIVYGLAADADGNLYGAEMTKSLTKDSNLYTINKETGAGKKIGSLGFNASGWGQDLAFDRNKNLLYGILRNLSFYDESLSLYELDVSTGEATMLQDIEVIGGLAIPYCFKEPLTHSILYWQDTDGVVKAWHMEGDKKHESIIICDNVADRKGWRIKAVHDINDSGSPDLIWQDQFSGELTVWYMDGLEKDYTKDILNPGSGESRIDPAWEMMAVYDLNNSGEPDIIWQRDDGQLAVWLMENQQAVRYGRLFNHPGQSAVSPDWEIGAVTDLFGDGKPEIIWQAVEGDFEDQLAYWNVDVEGEDFYRSASGRLSQVGGRAEIQSWWRMRTAVDLLGDGQAELLFQGISNGFEGRVSYWIMVEEKRIDGARLEPESLPPRWELVGSGLLAKPQ